MALHFQTPDKIQSADSQLNFADRVRYLHARRHFAAMSGFILYPLLASRQHVGKTAAVIIF